MTWRRLGIVYAPDGSQSWAKSHAALPFPVAVRDDQFRVFFSARDQENRSSIGWVDIGLGDKPEILQVGGHPVLEAAFAGHFDDSGIGMGSIVQVDGTDRLYYMGWNLGVLAPWRNSIGVAAGAAKSANFARMFRGPIMDRSPEDPYTLSYPWVLQLAPDDWRMWYGSNLAWGGASSDMQHVIKMAHSKDGLHWVRTTDVAVGFSAPDEYALARPCVLRDRDGFKMWFATRGEHYRIGAAVSTDGRNWTRKDQELGLDISEDGWDSEMVCYPCVINHRGKLYLFYNGNGYGKSGFGLAVWDN